MNKAQAIENLKANHQAFITLIDQLSEEEFMFQAPEKWSAGQQLEHIRLSVRPVVLAFSLPRFMLKILFGKTNRPSRSYDELVAKYHEKLQKGGRTTGPFVPKPFRFDQKIEGIKAVSMLIYKLEKQIESFTEASLDTLILPHPLLGKITLREMLYFTTYHVRHHQELVMKYLTK